MIFNITCSLIQEKKSKKTSSKYKVNLYLILTPTSDGSNFGSNLQKISSNGLRVTLARTLRRPLRKIINFRSNLLKKLIE